MNENLYQDIPDHTSGDMIFLENRIREFETELGATRANLEETRQRLSELENRLPDSLILSPIFLKRAFAVLGHYFVANLLVAIPIICISVIITLLLASIGAFGQ